MGSAGAVLAFDFGSPVASAAVARGGLALVELGHPRATPETDLLRLVDAVLRRAGIDRSDLAGVVALAGPGSFTGLRIACATAFALHQALGLPACGVSTLEALALAAPASSKRPLAVVDALRGEWFQQPFARSSGGDVHALTAAARGALVRSSPPECDLLVGFGSAALARQAGLALPSFEPAGLAAPVAVAASLGRWEWRAESLVAPLYLRAPAIGSGR